jgi:lipid-A-disaccharide synthase
VAADVETESSPSDSFVVGLLAGEPSGDLLGAGLMTALRAMLPDREVRFLGVGGARMQAAGLVRLADFDTLSVNGFRDPILRLPQLYRLYRELATTFVEARIDAFIGIDFNVFNLLLEARLKRQGIPTAHYVSPSVYAWRRWRTKKVARSADKLFCLFPFEPAFYERHAVDARFVGHPMAADIALDAGSDDARNAAQQNFGLAGADIVLAVLPGSRGSEVALMLTPMLHAAQEFADVMQSENRSVRVIIPCVDKARHAQVAPIANSFSGLKPRLYLGDARQPLIACDVALVKSGTSTLEAMLLRRPMVVTYRLGYWAYLIANFLVKAPFIAVPNILAGRMLVPELLQQAATPEAMCAALLEEFEKRSTDPEQLKTFEQLHRTLASGSGGLGASAGAAQGVIDLLTERENLTAGM